MNKSRRRVLLILLLLISIFGVSSVSAATKNISLEDISVKDKSGTITVVDPVLSSNEVTSNITFNQKDDFVTFELTLKNNESDKYKIESITDNNTNENIKIDYTYNKDFINTNDTSKVTIKLTYKNQLLNVDEVSLNDLNIKISLISEDGKEEEIIINPTTGDNILNYLVLLIIALTGLLLIAMKKRVKGIKVGSLFIIFAVVMIPFVAIAKEKYEINLKFTDVIVKGEFETYNISVDPGNGDPVEIRQVQYGQKLGDLPANPTKNGYNFNKWTDAEGNEVTKDTIVTKELEIIGTYNVITYNITYNLDNGTATNPGTYTVESQSISLSEPTKAGYAFTGWTGSNGTELQTSVTIPHGSTGDKTYTAHYSANQSTKYTVIHSYQNYEQTGYDSVTRTLYGPTDETVTPAFEEKQGFINPTSTQTLKILGDETASLTYYYQRDSFDFSITDRTYIDNTSTTDGTYLYETPITVKAVERAGYDFEWSDGNTDYERSFDLTEDKELTPIYTARTNTAYRVEHYQMDLDGVNYTRVDYQDLTGTTDAPITPAVNTYTGFTSPSTQSTTIAGDGSTVVKYYYTRNQSTVTITDSEYVDEGDISGDYYYGDTITLTAKERAGYAFTGWSNGETDNPLSLIVGADDINIKPNYSANTNTPYTVNHYQMDLDGENYTFVEADNESGTTDAPITPATKTYEGFTSPSTQTTTINGNGNTVVNYYYTRNQYTLTITNSQFVEEDKSGPHYYDEEITLTAIDRQGYNFAGWSTGETTKTITFSMPVNGITVEPLYTASDSTTYSVTHKYRKLTSEEEYDVVTVNGSGTTGDTIPAPLRPQTGFVTPSQVNITITPDGEANVVYTYQRETYTFSITDRTYLDNTSTPNDTYPYGTTITLKAIEREGYSFKWSDDVTDYERSFELESNVTSLSLVYTANTYTLTAYANNGAIAETTGWTGTGTSATKEITYNSTYGTLPTVTRTGYTLDRWNTSQDGNGTDITSATTVTTTSNQDIYAIWTPNTDTAYKVIHKKQNVTLDGYEEIVENLTGTTGALITPTVNTYTGFISPNAETTTIAADGSTEVVYTYNRETYTVSFDTDGGSTVPAQTVAYGAKVTEPSDNPTKEHYNFIDWYTTDSYSIAFNFAETTISGPTTIYAKFEIQTFTVTFDTDGGSTVPAQTVSYGGLVLRPTPDPTKTGLTFDDWYTDANFDTTFDFANTQITDTTTIYANFIDTCGTFSTDSWSTIKTNFASDPNYYGVGCEKEVEMDMNDDSTPESYTVRIANTSSPSVCETSGYSQTACGTVIEFVDVVEKHVMNGPYYTNVGGWKSSDMVTYLNNDFYNKLPNDLQNIIIPTYPIVSGSGSNGNSPDITVTDSTINKLYLLSGREVGLDLDYDNKKDVTTDTRTLDYYSANNNNDARKKYGDSWQWWLRTANSKNNDTFYSISDTGTDSDGFTSNNSIGVAPAFRIGTAPSFTVTFDTDGGSSVASQTVTYGELATLPTEPTKEDKVFAGWYADSNRTTLFDFSSPITGTTTIYAQWSSCNGFSSASWSTIKNNLNNNPNYYLVGCTKEVPIDMDEDGTDESYTIRLVNTSTPSVCSTSGYSQTGCGTVLEFVDVVASNKKIHSNGSTAGGWSESDGVVWVNNDFYNKLPSDLQDVIIPTYPIVSGDSRDSVTRDLTSADYDKNKIYLLSSRELGFDLNSDNKKDVLTNTRTLDFYEGIGSNSDDKEPKRIKYKLDGTPASYSISRTASIFSTSIYPGVDQYGEWRGITATVSIADIAPAFRIGTTPSFTVSFDTDGGDSVPTQTVSYGGLVIRPVVDPTKSGYTFDDWYTDSNYNTVFDFSVPITETTTIYAHFVDSCNGFSTDSWSTIRDNLEADSNYYAVGCTKEVEMDMNDDSTPESYTVRLANTSTPEVCSTEGYSQTACGTVIEFVDIVALRQLTSTRTNEGGWKATPLVTWVNSDLYDKLPSDLKSVIISTYPIVSGSGSGGNSPDITSVDTTINKLYLLSGREVGFNLSNDNKKDVTTDTRTLDYYLTIEKNSQRIKYDLAGEIRRWWLRTAYSDHDARFYGIYETGSYGFDYGTDNSTGVAPAFRIGTEVPSKYTVSFNSDGGSTIADIEVDAGDSINELPTPTKADSVFVGWFESVTDENPVPEPYTPSGDIELIAKWEKLLCKKASELHTEVCNQTDSGKYCTGDGYANGETIVYGNAVSSDTYLVGDALDCDVDGTGYNQRFYYLRTENDRAILISNKNYTAASGQADQNTSFIYSQAHDQLPTTSNWGNLPIKFDGKPARLITISDLLAITGASSTSDLTPNKSLKGYEFLFENSNFSGIGDRSTQWVEEISSTERYRYRNDSYNLAQVESGKENTSTNPVRPVIEVPTDLIEDAYIVKFDANGGNSTTEYAKVIKGNSVGTLPTTTREGYIFDGWYTSLEFTTEVTENTIPNGYVTYYAKWTGDISDASFANSSFILSIGDEDDIVINNSSDYESVTYTSNDTSIVTVNNSGHLTAVDDGETTITVTGSKSGHTRTINVKVTEEITDFVVHFDSMGGSNVADMFVPINTAIGSLPEDPILAENIFAGWYTNTNYSTKVTTDTVIRSDVTFYAKWIPENAVAEINHSYFTSLQDAFDSEMTGKTTIILLKDISVNNTYLNLYTKNLGKDIVLDLNNKTITGTGSQTIRTKTSLEIKNGTITQSSSNGTIDVGTGGHLIMNSVRVENSGERAAIYNEGGTVELGGTVYATSNALWASNNNRGTVQNKSGTTIITGGTYINTRSTNSYAVSATAGTLTIGTKDDIYDTTNLVIQGETGGIYSAVNYSLYDGMVKGITAAVENESKITSIEDNATKVNEMMGSYNALYYTLPVSSYKVTLDANGGTVETNYITVNAGEQIGTIPTPTRGEYIFDGWYDDPTAGNLVDGTERPTANMTIHARWHFEASNNVVNFNMNNGAIETYANSIISWKDETKSTFQANMTSNFTANSCSECDGANSCNNPSAGTRCDMSIGYLTGVNDEVLVYESDEINKNKGNLVTYTTSTDGTIYNMIPGETYYWESASDSTIHGLVKASGYRRMINTTVRNVRDLGGLEVDVDDDGTPDGTIKYGRLFRGAKLSTSQTDVTNLTKLGITREIDLRPDSEGKDNGEATLPHYDIDTPGAEEDIVMTNYLIDYANHPDNYTALRNTLKTVMNYIIADDDESIYFHCTIGTDRTGTLAYFLEGLLGVSEEDRVEDYELSYYFGLTNRDRYHDNLSGSSINPRFTTMHNTYNTNAKIYDWFMNEDPNITQSEKDADAILINTFRTKMINSY